MPRITDLLVEQLGTVSANYFANVAEPAHKILNMREQLLDGEPPLIKNIVAKNVEDISLACIDGGSLLQQLAGGDLIVAAATVGEGYTSHPVYSSEVDVPSEVYCEVLPHKQANNDLLSSVRSLLELRVLHETKTDWRIIDGAYLGNASTFLYSLIKEGSEVRDAVLSATNYDFDGILNSALNELLLLNPNKSNNIIAIPKSDSSVIFTKHIFKEEFDTGFKMTDRILSGIVLRPGEYFTPRSLKSNDVLIQRLNSLKPENDFIAKNKYSGVLWRLLEGKGELFSGLNIDSENELGKLYTTYLKPRKFSTSSPSIKVEFNHLPEYGTLEERVQEIVGIVDADIVDESMIEPWSQYFADVRAKEVSVGAEMIKNHLMSSVTTDYELAGLMRNYRT
jgi:hypothetical protein